MIKVNFEKCFEKVNYELLLTQLKNYMDQSCVELVGKLCKAGYCDIEGLADPTFTIKNIPQRSLISSVLCNIYLHSLDAYIVEELLSKYNFGDIKTSCLKCKCEYELASKNKKFLSVSLESEEGLKQAKFNRALDKGLSKAMDFDIIDYIMSVMLMSLF